MCERGMRSLIVSKTSIALPQFRKKIDQFQLVSHERELNSPIGIQPAIATMYVYTRTSTDIASNVACVLVYQNIGSARKLEEPESRAQINRFQAILLTAGNRHRILQPLAQRQLADVEADEAVSAANGELPQTPSVWKVGISVPMLASLLTKSRCCRCPPSEDF